MNRFLATMAAATLTLIFGTVVLAGDQQPTQTQTKDIVDTAVAAGQFKTLAAALTAADLVGAAASDPHALKQLKKKYPTGAFARFEFDAPAWKDIAPGMGRLVAFVRPNDLDKD